MRSPNLWRSDGGAVSDAEDHADAAIFEFLEGRSPMDSIESITKATADSYMNWFLPLAYGGK